MGGKRKNIASRLTRPQASDVGSRAGATQSEAKQVSLFRKVLSSENLETVLQQLLADVEQAIVDAWETLNDRLVTEPTPTRRVSKGPVADPREDEEDLWPSDDE